VTDLEDIAKQLSEEKESEEQPEQNSPSQEQQKQEEVRELLSKIQALEASGQEDQSLIAELSKRGVSNQMLNNAWQQHIQDFPEHGHDQQVMQMFLEQEEDLEERLKDVQAKENSNPLYDVQSRLEEGVYVTKDEIYNALDQAQTYIAERGGMTDNEYQAINTIEERMQKPGYISNQATEDIKNMGKVKIGNDYLRNDQRL
jgi:hypothetical protein